MSRKVFIAAVLGAALASTGAYAATQHKVGEIKSTDSVKRELLLSTGDTFQVPASIKLESLKIGEKVNVAFDTKDGKFVASKIHPSK